jgi:serine-type D-Ala-D-Ala carboxypeptidase (penicillin-binding protein 5/6)
MGPAAAQDVAAAFESKAPNAILIDAKSGEVLYEKAADVAVPPASMSKLMTQAIVFDMLKSGALKPDQEFLVSTDAWRRGGSPAGGSTMYAEVNSRIKIIDLLRGAIIQSANDACIALAEGIAGSEPSFVQRMNSKARDMELKQSFFVNATGLPDPGHRMSVRDLSSVARYIHLNHPGYFKLYGEPSFVWNDIEQQNRNPLLKEFPGADGMKTGYTRESGYGLVGTAERDGRRLIMVVAGLLTINDRREEAQKILDWGFRQFKTFDVYEAGEMIGAARVWGGETRWVGLQTREVFRVALSPKEQETVEVKLDYEGPLLAPVVQGTEIGKIRVLVKGNSVSEVPVFATADVEPIESMWWKAFDSMLLAVTGK